VKPRPSRAGAGRRPARTLEPRSADAAVKDVLALYGITDEVRAERVHTEWYDLVGPRIAQRTRPYGIVGKTLVIEVASSAWVQELTLLRQQILTGLLARIGEPRLFEDLKFRLAGTTDRHRPLRVPPRGRPAPPPPPKPTEPATGIARENIARDVERVDDLELRELIARVRISHDR
jgi:predicted nucleic acid-binding Zn ribbon protein